MCIRDRYESYATALEENRQVILFDQRGTGKSVQHVDKRFTLNQMTRDLELLRRHLGIDKWDIFGHSFGSLYAIYYILEYSENTDKVVLSAAPAAGEYSGGVSNFQNFKHPQPENLTDLEIQLFYEFEDERKKPNANQERLYRLSTAMRARYYVSKPESYAPMAEWWLYKAEPCLPKYQLDLKMRLSTKKIKQRLRNFENEVLIIHGIGDFINVTNPLKNHELFPNSKLKILSDAGHTMSIDSPKEYFEAINEFLTK